MGETSVPGAAERAAALLGDLAGGNWPEARAGFTAAMRSALGDEELATAWAQVTVQMGEYRGMGEPAITGAGDLTNVTIPLEFDSGVIGGCVSFDAQGKVAGLHFLFTTDGSGRKPVTGNLVLRCSDGHLYVASRDALLWRTMHFGTKQLRPCPVDHKWRVAVFVDPRELSKAELEQAESVRV